jgi:hypothetical protein
MGYFHEAHPLSNMLGRNTETKIAGCIDGSIAIRHLGFSGGIVFQAIDLDVFLF